MRRVPRLRQPYGPHERRSYVEPYGHLVARVAPDRGYERHALPMPNGGVRYVALCPRCRQRRTKLYPVALNLPGVYWCRVCLRLKYRSQYQGRRIEASDVRLEWADERLRKADGKIDELRLQRYCAASDHWCAKMDHYRLARDLDFLGALARMLALIDREERRMERRRVYMWRYRRGWHAGDHLHIVPAARPGSGIGTTLSEMRATLKAAQERARAM